MPDEAIQQQIKACESAKGTDKFLYAVEALLKLLPKKMHEEVNSDPRIYKDEVAYINRFINNVLVTVEFTNNKVVDHDAMLAVIQEKLKQTDA
jgi:hypothetical protein